MNRSSRTKLQAMPELIWTCSCCSRYCFYRRNFCNVLWL